MGIHIEAVAAFYELERVVVTRSEKMMIRCDTGLANE